MKYCFFTLLFVANFVFAQSDSSPNWAKVKWSFTKRICISQNDTIIQLPDPRNGSVTDTTRPYFDIEINSDGTYQCEIAYFKSKGEYWRGKWKSNEANEIFFISQFENDPVRELNNCIIKIIDDQLTFNNYEGCVYQFKRK